MTKTLTEQWRDNDLSDNKLYYWRISDGQELVQNKLGMCAYRLCNDSDKIECLAPVPSYDEYKELVRKTEQLEKRLKIATKALNDILNDGDDYWDKDKAQEALTKMKGVK